MASSSILSSVARPWTRLQPGSSVDKICNNLHLAYLNGKDLLPYLEESLLKKKQLLRPGEIAMILNHLGKGKLGEFGRTDLIQNYSASFLNSCRVDVCESADVIATLANALATMKDKNKRSVGREKGAGKQGHLGGAMMPGQSQEARNQARDQHHASQKEIRMFLVSITHEIMARLKLSKTVQQFSVSTGGRGISRTLPGSMKTSIASKKPYSLDLQLLSEEAAMKEFVSEAGDEKICSEDPTTQELVWAEESLQLGTVEKSSQIPLSCRSVAMLINACGKLGHSNEELNNALLHYIIENLVDLSDGSAKSNHETRRDEASQDNNGDPKLEGMIRSQKSLDEIINFVPTIPLNAIDIGNILNGFAKMEQQYDQALLYELFEKMPYQNVFNTFEPSSICQVFNAFVKSGFYDCNWSNITLDDSRNLMDDSDASKESKNEHRRIKSARETVSLLLRKGRDIVLGNGTNKNDSRNDSEKIDGKRKRDYFSSGYLPSLVYNAIVHFRCYQSDIHKTEDWRVKDSENLQTIFLESIKKDNDFDFHDLVLVLPLLPKFLVVSETVSETCGTLSVSPNHASLVNLITPLFLKALNAQEGEKKGLHVYRGHAGCAILSSAAKCSIENEEFWLQGRDYLRSLERNGGNNDPSPNSRNNPRTNVEAHHINEVYTNYRGKMDLRG